VRSVFPCAASRPALPAALPPRYEMRGCRAVSTRQRRKQRSPGTCAPGDRISSGVPITTS
jgi:hypothetical protein